VARVVWAGLFIRLFRGRSPTSAALPPVHFPLVANRNAGLPSITPTLPWTELFHQLFQVRGGGEDLHLADSADLVAVEVGLTSNCGEFAIIKRGVNPDHLRPAV
jgi:hypothetical protein